MQNVMVTILTRNDIKNIFLESLKEFEAAKDYSLSKTKTFSINEVAKMTGRSHATITNLVKSGILKTTSDQRRITAISLNEYLDNL